MTPPPTTGAPVTTLPPTAAPATPSSCAVDSAEYDYDEVLQKSLLFYEAQRSGYLPASQRVTWRRDSATDDALDAETNKAVDLEGGYYDGESALPRRRCAGVECVVTPAALDFGTRFSLSSVMGWTRPRTCYTHQTFIGTKMINYIIIKWILFHP